MPNSLNYSTSPLAHSFKTISHRGGVSCFANSLAGMELEKVKEKLMNFTPWSMSSKITALVHFPVELWPLNKHPHHTAATQ